MSTIAFRPARLGELALANHIVMAPMTRSRAPGTVPTALMADYRTSRTPTSSRDCATNAR
jgi:N-ethylmaleimide reductase